MQSYHYYASLLERNQNILRFGKTKALSLSWLQHGESEYNVLGKVGGDAVLSARGERYAQALATKFNAMRIPDLRVLTSRLRRTIATARGVEAPQEHVAALNELHAGICEGLSYEEMQEHYPQVISNQILFSSKFRHCLHWIPFQVLLTKGLLRHGQ